MALFTLFMVANIDAFGVKMRAKGETNREKLYQPIGVVVLLAIGSLIVAGWTLAAVPRGGEWTGWAELLAVLAVVVHLVLARAVLGRITRRAES
jgi:hypothetical protein